MRVPLEWLADYVDLDLSTHELAQTMTMRGLKVEAVERIGQDWEDVVVGVVPMVSLGRAIGRPLPLLEATITFAEALLGCDLLANGRTIEHLGLAGMDRAAIRKRVRGAYA